MTVKHGAAALTSALLLTVAGGAFAAVSHETVTRTSPDALLVTWEGRQPVDVYVADRADAALSDARLVSAGNKAGRYEMKTEAGARAYFLLQDKGDQAVAKVAERVLPLAQGSNFRDIGGYPAAGGKHVRWGLIYRSGATPMLTDADLAMVKKLDLIEMIDLRSSEERVLAPTRIEGVPYTAVGYSMSRVMGQAAPTGDERMHAIYANFPTLLAPQMRALFSTLLADQGPVAYNCSAGQDRTGFATALILSALGVPRDVIIADYHLSTTYRRPAYEMPKIQPAMIEGNPAAALFAHYQKDPKGMTPQPLLDSQKQPLLKFALDEIDRRWGSVEGYLDKERGVDAADIAKLRADYLE